MIVDKVYLTRKVDVFLGANYRNLGFWAVSAGIQAGEAIQLGYIFELPTSQLSRVNVQSQEIALRYSFRK